MTETYSITRNGQVIVLTDDEVKTIVYDAIHKKNIETCRIMTIDLLRQLEILGSANMVQTDTFIANALPDTEADRIARLYEARETSQFSAYDSWTAVLAEQILGKNSVMCQYMVKIISEKASDETRRTLLNNPFSNPSKCDNLTDMLNKVSGASLISIWKTYRFINEL